MRYKLLGRTGLRVSELCLGAMIFGGTRGGWGASKEEVARIVERFAEAGGNFIDTANHYAAGESERIVGELVAAERERWVLSTKYTLTVRPDDLTAAAPIARAWSSHWRRACGGSAPTTSTCTGSTSGMSSRRSKRWRGPWTTWSAPARSSMSGSPTRPPGSSPRRSPWPTCAAEPALPACRCPTALSSAASSGSCCRWPRPWS